MGQHMKAVAEAFVLKQHGEKCKRSEAQNDNDYDIKQIIIAYTNALSELSMAYGNIKWKQWDMICTGR